MYTNMDKTPMTWRTRLSFLRTKRAIAGLSLLTCVVIILIALGATGTIGHHSASQSSLASTTSPSPTSTSSAGSSSTTTSAAPPAFTSAPGSIADGTPLRVMCLGASIVKGEHSNGTLGFRKPLRDDLAALGVPVNMVGSVRLGDMVDNDLEAYGGFRVSQIFEAAKKSVPKIQPNVFVINVGTNNVLQYRDIGNASIHMENFVNYLLETSPRSVVIMSTLLVNTVPNREPYILEINEKYRALMTTFEKEGKHVVLAEMHPNAGVADRPEISDISEDGSHPTEKGYAMMGHIFAASIQEADQKGFLQKPIDNDIPDDGVTERSGTIRRRGSR